MKPTSNTFAGLQPFRGVPVVSDAYLAAALGLPSARLRALVDRHADRFPPDFVFALTDSERARFGIVVGELPVVAFTECGVTMLISLLRTPLAAEMAVVLVRRLRALRRLVAANAEPLAPLMSPPAPTSAMPLTGLYAAFAQTAPTNGVFLKNALYAPRAALARLFGRAKQSIEIHDDCIPSLALEELARRRPEVVVKLVTLAKCPVAKSRLAALNARHQLVSVEYRPTIACRAIVLDGTQVFRLGRSLRDLGRQPFAIIKDPPRSGRLR